MSTMLLERPVVKETDDGEDLDHSYCGTCYPEHDKLCISLCGIDVTELELIDEPDYGKECPKCEQYDLCPVCGHVLYT